MINNIEPSANHPQSIAVCKYLKTNNIGGFNNLQNKLKLEAQTMIDENTRSKSFSIDPASLNINKIACHLPKGGIRVLKFYSVEDGSWFKPFTGNNWRVDSKTIFGKMGDVVIDLENNVKLVIDLENTNSKVTVTNITLSNKNIVTFGPTERGTSFSHMIGCITNHKYMFQQFNKGNNKITGKLSKDIDPNSDAFSIGEMSCTLAKDAVMPVDNTITNESLILPKIHDNDAEGKCNDSNLCETIIENIPELVDNMFIYGKNRDGFVLRISDNAGETNDWATNPDIWEKLLSIMAEKCDPTVDKS